MRKSASAYSTRRIVCGKPATETDPKLKEDFLNLEQRWLFLARSYEFAKRLGDFSDEAKPNTDKLPRAY